MTQSTKKLKEEEDEEQINVFLLFFSFGEQLRDTQKKKSNTPD